MIRAIQVTANDDYSILVMLEDGRTLKVDMKFLKNQSGPVVESLKDVGEFKKVFVRNGIVTWSTGYDIDPYYLIEQGSVVTKTA
jgi:hypothetical protein